MNNEPFSFLLSYKSRTLPQKLKLNWTVNDWYVSLAKKKFVKRFWEKIKWVTENVFLCWEWKAVILRKLWAQNPSHFMTKFECNGGVN